MQCQPQWARGQKQDASQHTKLFATKKAKKNKLKTVRNDKKKRKEKYSGKQRHYLAVVALLYLSIL